MKKSREKDLTGGTHGMASMAYAGKMDDAF
jgi:hypothetical protein